MTVAELFETYPKAAEVVIKYYNNVFINNMEDSEIITEEFREFAKLQIADNQYIISFIDINPRGAFDVFDENEIYIGITPIYTMETIKYKYTVGATMTGEAPNRKEADKIAIEIAFNMLNSKL